MAVLRYLALFLLIGSILLLPTTVFSANHYILAGATGSNNGSSWANAWTAFPAASSLVRGDTYYVGAGTYQFEGATYRITKALSGEAYITIKKATVAENSGDAGWNASFAGQAVFNRATTTAAEQPIIQIETSYITIDGVVGSMSADVDDYGFKFTPPTDGCNTRASSGIYLYTSSAITNINISHVALVGCGDHDPRCSNGIKSTAFQGETVTQVSITDNYFSDFTNSIAAYRGSYFTIARNYFASNWSASYCHGQQIAPDGITDSLLYDNYFGYTEYALFSAHTQTGRSNSRWKIYNNIIDGGGATFNLWIDGAYLSGSEKLTYAFDDCDIHHNTHVNIAVSSWGAVFPGNLTDVDTQKSRFYNNIFYNCSNPKIYEIDAGSIVHDNNAYLKCTGTYPGNGTVTAEAAGQVDTETESPFNTGVYTISTTWDAAQVSAEEASLIGKGKTDLGSPYDIDMAGNSRDATPDIGAYESGASADETAPTLAEVTPVTASSPNQAPQYTFSSDEAGTVTYGGTCGNGSLSTAVVGNNTTQWNLAIGTYSNCTITVTDAASNASTPLAVTEFVITPTDSSAAKTIEGGVSFQSLP